MFIFSPRRYNELLAWIKRAGKVVKVGDNETIEIVNANLVVLDPRDRLMQCQGRKLIFPFGIAEWIGLLLGEDKVKFFSSFIDYSPYSTDGVIVDGAYGPRLHWPADQIAGVIKELKRDPYSRRAVATIYRGHRDLYGWGGKNTPCTLTLQFVIREGKLNLITTMRSNDAIWGLNYDLIMFTMLQEYVSTELNVPLGTYYHNAGSLHLYERHYHLIESLNCDKGYPYVMEPMPKFTYWQLKVLQDAYRNAADDEAFNEAISILPFGSYLSDLAWAARAYAARKEDPLAAKKAYRLIESPAILNVMRSWIGEE